MSGKKKTYHILMGDVIGSSDYDPMKLGRQLKDLVRSANQDLRYNTLSPYVVTLGDEFQGVTRSLAAGIKTLFFFEEKRLTKGLDFKMQYVLHYGIMETGINPESSYGMLGEGLSQARKKLTAKTRGRKRFNFSLGDKQHSEQLNRLFGVLDGISERWKKADYGLISDMIQNDNDREVGKMYDKDRSQIYRRRKTLMTQEYLLLKEFIFTYINLPLP